MVTSLDRADVKLPDFPSYSWVFGCSAVSAAMIAAYYDNNGYPNMYTGPTNGGVMPVSDMYAPYSGTYVWGSWNDGSDSYPNNPLIASHDGIDGQVVRGSIDDYWVSYGSGANDPFITNSWLEHTPGTAVGDYMKTSQSLYENIDGSTWFYYAFGNSKLQCSSMPIDDGTYGRKLFYEARGYTVTDCFYQQTDNKVSGGFSLLDFQAEIDAGHPVLINVTGHSMVGFGYNGSTIYIRDTWNSNPNNNYSMTWGGTYDGRELLGISIVHLTEPSSAPGAFTKSSPSDAATGLTINPTMNWGASSQSYGYQYCYDTTDDNACSNWVDTGFNTSVNLSGLSYNTPYFWQVRSINPLDTTYGNGDPTAFWSFSTMDAPVLSEKMFLPLMVRN
ncbi:MAG TPA: hypothetical protein DF984_01020 [Anaerolineaceae bacterium]|nr:hypothetical protein [Anaerolineaceae bacterium]